MAGLYPLPIGLLGHSHAGHWAGRLPRREPAFRHSVIACTDENNQSLTGTSVRTRSPRDSIAPGDRIPDMGQSRQPDRGRFGRIDLPGRSNLELSLERSRPRDSVTAAFGPPTATGSRLARAPTWTQANLPKWIRRIRVRVGLGRLVLDERLVGQTLALQRKPTSAALRSLHTQRMALGEGAGR